MTDNFSSSDSDRSAAQLHHAKYVTFDEALTLELGGQLERVTVCYETYGTLSPARDNAVYICHALSGDSHVARHDDSDEAGWWDLVVGPGKAIDTDKYFVICANILGGCRGTTGPNCANPATGKAYGAEFPRITIADMVDVQRMLLDSLAIDKLLAVIGGSMGGMQVLQWAVGYPDRVRAAIPLATTCRLSAQALGFDIVGRNAIRKDPGYRDGQYYDGAGPASGLAIARMIGHITYLSGESMENKFDADRHNPRDVDYAYEKEFSVGSYLAYLGGRFVDRFDANSYIKLSLAMDQFDLASGRPSLAEAMRLTRCRWLVISFTSDWLFPARQSRTIVDAIIAAERPVTYCNVESDCGHDAFLLPDALDTYGAMIEAFLARTFNGAAVVDVPPAGAPCPDERSIFHSRRLDYDLIEKLIPPGKGVLDLGCGDGELLARFKRRGQQDLLGLELDSQAILTAMRRGLDVVQFDLDTGLGSFRDRQFEVVLLSQTLQTVSDPKKVLLEMLRVGEVGIASFPNFAHKDCRRQLCELGVAPMTSELPYTWYHSPNRHFLSIVDFENFCREFGITIHRRIALDSTSGVEVADNPNLNADLAIFVLSRP
ncbi:MAG: homoserine O-acetyltransferase [Planctomycetes bacterium]|nr:homoserine O-acetyltransferase [Planctomycetota bacterium]